MNFCSGEQKVFYKRSGNQYRILLYGMKDFLFKYVMWSKKKYDKLTEKIVL